MSANERGGGRGSLSKVDSLFSILVTNPVKSLYFLSTSMRILSRSLSPDHEQRDSSSEAV